MPPDEPINYDSCSYADFYDKISPVIQQDEIDRVQCLECPCGTCGYEFTDVSGFFRHLFQAASEEYITLWKCKVRIPVTSEA
eukprot:11413470-Karenia_brevis.AAC.1